MSVRSPLRLSVPKDGVLVAESAHASPFRMRAERHAFHQVYFVYRGRVLYRDDSTRRPVELAEGQCYPIPRTVNHWMEDRARSVLLLLCLSPGFIEKHRLRTTLWDAIVKHPAAPLTPDAGLWLDLLHALRRIMAEQASPGLGGELAVAAEADRILVALARLPGERYGGSGLQRVAHVLEVVGENLSEDWNIELAAQRAGLSRRRFTDLVRQLTGQSFLQRLTELRLEKAAELLTSGRHTILEVAFSCGFMDPSHFYRLFTSRFGMSPGVWAHRTRDGDK